MERIDKIISEQTYYTRKEIKKAEEEIITSKEKIEDFNDFYYDMENHELVGTFLIETNELVAYSYIALYENSETTYLDVLLNSKSIVDFISRYYIIEEIR